MTTPSTILSKAMAELSADLEAARARFNTTLRTALPDMPPDGEPLDDATFTGICAACTTLTRHTSRLQSDVARVVASLEAARRSAGIEPACPCYGCVSQADRCTPTPPPPKRRRGNPRLN